jgi:hypothetical protein
VNFKLVSAAALGDAFGMEGAAVQDLGGGNFEIVLPNPGGSTKFFRVQITLK